MFVTIAIVALCQFKADDPVYIKADRAAGYLTEKLARVRYEPAFGYSVAASDVPAGGGTEFVVRWPKYTKVKVLTSTKVDGDHLVRVHHELWKMSYWYHAEDLGAWTKDVEERARADQASGADAEKLASAMAKLSPYIKTQNERQAVSAAFAAGLNPLAMTAKDAAVLSTGQRKSISTVRQRYTKGNRVSEPEPDR